MSYLTIVCLFGGTILSFAKQHIELRMSEAVMFSSKRE